MRVLSCSYYHYLNSVYFYDDDITKRQAHFPWENQLVNFSEVEYTLYVYFVLWTSVYPLLIGRCIYLLSGCHLKYTCSDITRRKKRRKARTSCICFFSGSRFKSKVDIRFTRQSLSRLSFMQKIVRAELVLVKRVKKKDNGITVKLSSICKTVSYLASFRGCVNCISSL